MGQNKIAPSHLRHTTEHLLGREQELAALDQAWNNPPTNVFSIVAWPGAGKTSLVVRWMAQKAKEDWPGFERVFEWSFNSQGIGKPGAASADTFIASALEFFGDPALAASAASPQDKGAQLAQLVTRRRALLVLDGLEPLQHPPGGPLAGQLRDKALEAMLSCLALDNLGLCVLTSHVRVANLDGYRETTAPVLELQRLSTPAGIELLKTVGVHGTEAEFQQLVERVAGHALTLDLLGRYLAEAHNGDICRQDQVKLDKADEEIKGGAAFETVAAYEQWLSSGGERGQRQLAMLRVLGLFDRPADAGCLEALRREPAITSLTEPLVGLEEADWNLILSTLRKCGLIYGGVPSAARAQPSLDTHPLVHEYFAKQLRERHAEAWRLAHLRLHKHLASIDIKAQPTLEDLRPLYRAVVHGCLAGEPLLAFGVYHDRILGEDYYSQRRLGAVQHDLAVIRYFFDEEWTRPSGALPIASRAWLLRQVGFRLRALGMIEDARIPWRTAFSLATEVASAEIWPTEKRLRCASMNAESLSRLELLLGKVDAALGYAHDSFKHAKDCGSPFQQAIAKCSLADALYQRGDRDQSGRLFHEAEKLFQGAEPEHELHRRENRCRHCELQLAEPERFAWQELMRGTTQIPPAHEYAFCSLCAGIAQSAIESLETAEVSSWHSLMACAHLLWARAAVCRAAFESDGAPRTAAIQTARRESEAGIKANQDAGNQHETPRHLLTHAWCCCAEAAERRTQGRPVQAAECEEAARADLNNAWQIAERGPMWLHMADIHLHRARLFFREKPYPWTSPQADLAAAEKLINDYGYHRRDEELADAKKVILGS